MTGRIFFHLLLFSRQNFSVKISYHLYVPASGTTTRSGFALKKLDSAGTFLLRFFKLLKLFFKTISPFKCLNLDTRNIFETGLLVSGFLEAVEVDLKTLESSGGEISVLGLLFCLKKNEKKNIY